MHGDCQTFFRCCTLPPHFAHTATSDPSLAHKTLLLNKSKNLKTPSIFLSATLTRRSPLKLKLQFVVFFITLDAGIVCQSRKIGYFIYLLFIFALSLTLIAPLLVALIVIVVVVFTLRFSILCRQCALLCVKALPLADRLISSLHSIDASLAIVVSFPFTFGAVCSYSQARDVRAYAAY